MDKYALTFGESEPGQCRAVASREAMFPTNSEPSPSTTANPGHIAFDCYNAEDEQG